MILFEERIVYTGNGDESDVIGEGVKAERVDRFWEYAMYN